MILNIQIRSPDSLRIQNNDKAVIQILHDIMILVIHHLSVLIQLDELVQAGFKTLGQQTFLVQIKYNFMVPGMPLILVWKDDSKICNRVSLSKQSHKHYTLARVSSIQ